MSTNDEIIQSIADEEHQDKLEFNLKKERNDVFLDTCAFAR